MATNVTPKGQCDELDSAWAATEIEGAVRGLGVSLSEVVEDLRTKRDEYAAEAAKLRRNLDGLRRTLDEALNSGDGSYRP